MIRKIGGVEDEGRPYDQPAKTLLQSWGRRMSSGQAAMIPVFIGGAWTIQVPRGNKRVLRVNIPKKKK